MSSPIVDDLMLAGNPVAPKKPKPKQKKAAAKKRAPAKATKATKAKKTTATRKKAAKKKATPKTSQGKKPDYKKHPKIIKLPVSGLTLENPDAGCGPDEFLMQDGTCKRKFSKEVLGLLCPKVSVKKGQLNPAKMAELMKEQGLKGTPFTDEELTKLQEVCDSMHEQVMDETQSMDGKDMVVYELLKAQFAAMPMLFGKKLFDNFFGAIGYKTTSVSPTFVEIKKRVKQGADIVKQIPFGAIASSVFQRVKSGVSTVAKKSWEVGSFLAKQGFKAAQWVINSPQAQRFLMHMAKLVKHGICTAMGQLKDREGMTWTAWGKEKWTQHKTDVFQMMQAAAPSIGMAMGAAIPGLGLLAGPAISALGTMVIGKAAQTGRFKDVIDTFATGCTQFEYGLDESAMKQYFLSAGIGTFGPQLAKFLSSIDANVINSILSVVGIQV